MAYIFFCLLVVSLRSFLSLSLPIQYNLRQFEDSKKFLEHLSVTTEAVGNEMALSDAERSVIVSRLEKKAAEDREKALKKKAEKLEEHRLCAAQSEKLVLLEAAKEPEKLVLLEAAAKEPEKLLLLEAAAKEPEEEEVEEVEEEVEEEELSASMCALAVEAPIFKEQSKVEQELVFLRLRVRTLDVEVLKMAKFALKCHAVIVEGSLEVPVPVPVGLIGSVFEATQEFEMEESEEEEDALEEAIAAQKAAGLTASQDLDALLESEEEEEE
jgi:hypothetical protein